MLIIRRLNCVVAASGIVTLSKWLSGAQVERELRSLSTCAPQHTLCVGHADSDDTRCCINTIQPPDDEHIMLETCR